MKISRLGHFIRVAVASGAAIAAEAASSSPLVHGAWAPAVILGLRWLAQELGAGNDHG